MAAATSGINRSVAPAWTAGIRLGSLLSVISLSEIRYEGFLMELTPHPYTIGLRNVRLLGTEGRKKSGRQIPPSDKIYEYIYLRGNNIKDLRVISSPSTQSRLLVPEDPAIIRPRVAQPAPTTMASTSHGAVGANVSTSAQPILPGTSFQFNQSRDLFASSSSVRRSLLPPPANNSRLVVPSYLSALAGSSGIMSHFQQKLPPPPPSLLASNAPVQQQVQRQNANAFAVGRSLLASKAPVQQQVQRQNANTSAVGPSLLASKAPVQQQVQRQNANTFAVGPSLLASKAPVQQQVQRQNANTSTVGPSLLALKTPVQQQVQRQNANTSAVGGSSFVAWNPPLLLRRSTTSSNAVPPLVSTPSVQSNPGRSSPSQSLQIMDAKAKTALAPVMESLPSDSIEETLESSLKLTTETGSTPSHHEKGQSSQGKEQVHQGPHEDTGHSLGGKNEKPSVKRGFKEDFNFEAMNKKFNKKEVWDYFSKSKGEARRLRDNSKPVYSKEEFFDSLSYGATDNESAKVRISEQKDAETFGAEIPIIQEHRGPRKQVWRPRVK